MERRYMAGDRIEQKREGGEGENAKGERSRAIARHQERSNYASGEQRKCAPGGDELVSVPFERQDKAGGAGDNSHDRDSAGPVAFCQRVAGPVISGGLKSTGNQRAGQGAGGIYAQVAKTERPVGMKPLQQFVVNTV